ncbi:hypothetical protein Q1695_014642 [Nippostrongylus brasiliensis]|nr:hypothetical protein Q1695_014642 [Nippostrongylus brasiliensis]
MRSGRIVIAVLLIATLHSVSSFAVHQNDLQRECFDMQCPAMAFDSGVKNLIDEDTLSTKQCLDCSQCTSSGYSVCLRIQTSRASRLEEGRTACSCAHSMPANCHNSLDGSRQPANISMKSYNICYMSALQAPPRPLAVNEKTSVIFTIEPFWLEPYWRELVLENLTFHYDFAVKAPEHCEGDTVSSDDGQHLCTNAIMLNITVGGVTGNEEPRDDDYEHSEDYDQYDDDLPEEVEIDREIFAGADEVHVYYVVDVNRPRQYNAKGGSSNPIHDTKTSVESEILKYDLKSGYQAEAEELPVPADTKEEDEDVSEEQGGTEFFENDESTKNDGDSQLDDKKDEDKNDKTGEEKTKEDEANEEQNPEEEKQLETDEDAKNDDASEENDEEKDEKNEEDEEKKEEEEQADDDENKEVADSEEKTNEDEQNENKNEEKEGEEKEDDNEEDDEKEEENDTSIEKQHDDVDNDESNDDSQEDDDKELSFTQRIVKDKGMLARWVFGITIAVCLLFILCVCTFRRRCCKQKEGNKTCNGHRYSSVNGQPLVASPEKERLHQ